VTRSCIFCGRTTDSVEDAWPRWLTAKFVNKGTMHSQMFPDAAEKSWPIKRPTVRVRCVCKTCNGGWMSNLEQRAIAIIDPLLVSEKCTLHPSDCKAVSLWAVKTAMVFESISPAVPAGFSDLDRTLLSAKEIIPAFTRVWIAKCQEWPTVYTESRTMSTASETISGRVTTIAFGHFAVQVPRIIVPPTVDPNSKITVEERNAQSWSEASFQVWPPRNLPISWPATLGILGGYGLDEFSRRFTPDSASGRIDARLSEGVTNA
jgi:hypothetical protein